ncbi:MAG: Xaa-Pro peptidase family protein [Acetobacteraceae bacterium]|nr:Xaa-Pro peptidase family protein [Acetobacteraceae bacterium]
MDRPGWLRERLRRERLDFMLVSSPSNVAYLTGFRAVSYTRPVMLLVGRDTVLVLPALELEHARAVATACELRPYGDEGLGGVGGRSPFDLALDEVVAAASRQGINRPGCRLGVEADAVTWEGYRRLAGALRCELVPTRGLVEEARMVKDQQELELIRSGCALADHGMAVAVAATRVGVSELELMAEGDRAMLLEAVRRFPGLVVSVGSRPVSGPKSALPHALPGGRVLETGDVVLHGAGAVVEGYCCEVERTVFLGQPRDARMQEAFAAMERAQWAGIQAIRPGVTCREVDRACRRALEEAGFGRFILHRSGHGMGLDVHEAPYLSESDETVLSSGMVVSVEPGIYLPGVGGFRHSDTVLVTPAGAQCLTRYPRGLERLVR